MLNLEIFNTNDPNFIFLERGHWLQNTLYKAYKSNRLLRVWNELLFILVCATWLDSRFTVLLLIMKFCKRSFYLNFVESLLEILFFVNSKN